MHCNFRQKPLYRLFIWIGAAVCFVLLVWIGMDIVTSQNWLMGDDYVEYWAAGQLNLSGGNPYNPNQLSPLQLSTGKNFAVPVMMYNPPWLLILAMPFGSLDYPLSRTLWLILFVCIIFYCSDTLWRIYGGSQRGRYLSWLIGFTFIPVLEALKTGQASPLTLLGVTGFLLFQNRNKDFWAGIFISFLIVKPHLLYIVGLAVLIWSIQRKRWMILLGIITSLFVGTFISWIINPSVINQYFFAIQNYPPYDWATPTIGGILRLIFGQEYVWLQLIAPILGVIWFVSYWWKKNQSWNWLNETPLLILVSVFTAAFGWSSDQIVSLVAIIQIGVLVLSYQCNRYTVLITIVYLLIEGLILLVLGNALMLWWLAPSLLLWYIWASRILKNPQSYNLQSIQNK